MLGLGRSLSALARMRSAGFQGLVTWTPVML
jgi:hypothetical protein